MINSKESVNEIANPLLKHELILYGYTLSKALLHHNATTLYRIAGVDFPKQPTFILRNGTTIHMTFSNSSLAAKATEIALAQQDGQDIILKPNTKGEWIINALPGDYDLSVKVYFWERA